MKRPAEVVRDIERRLSRTWADSIVGEEAVPAWPHRFSLSQSSSRELEAEFDAVVAVAIAWRDWVRDRDVELIDRGRRIGSVSHSIPSQLVVPNVDEAARISGGAWGSRLERGRVRYKRLRSAFPHVGGLVRVVREVDRYGDVDFDLLIRAAQWFAVNSGAGLTPRQVPLAGFHAKWLNTSQHLVATLAGVDGLSLSNNHPSRIHFTYLDPGHLAAGGRRHDSASVGDRFTPAYMPETVVISENKDTAINFPELAGGISVEGVGRRHAVIAAFEWLTNAAAVIYWGDMDPDGLEILHGFLAAGVPVRPIFMDLAAYEQWEQYGTDVDKNGAVLTAREPRNVGALQSAQRELYLSLVSPEWRGPRRVEQERIPLATARAEVLAAAARG